MNKSKDSVIEIIRKKYRKPNIFKRIFAWDWIIENIINEVKDIDFNNLEEITKIESLSTVNLKLEKEKEKLNNELKEANNLKAIIEEQLKNSNESIEKYTKEIHNIFRVAKGDSKGKAVELGLRVKLQNSLGEVDELWTENLATNKNTKDRVEFAIRSTKDDKKWIPVDSKAYEPEIDEDDNIIITSKFIASLRSAAEQMTKYIGKSNTHDIGLLVIPSDEVYSLLHRNYKDTIDFAFEKGVQITSPSVFIQFANAIKGLASKFTQIRNAKSILKEVDVIASHMNNFYNSTKFGVDNINKAFDTHLKNINKKIDSVKKLDIPNIIDKLEK